MLVISAATITMLIMSERYHQICSRMLLVLLLLCVTVLLVTACCIISAGHKERMRWFQHYVVAVLSMPGQLDGPPSHALQVFDLRNKLIASSVTLSEVCAAGCFGPA